MLLSSLEELGLNADGLEGYTGDGFGFIPAGLRGFTKAGLFCILASVLTEELDGKLWLIFFLSLYFSSDGVDCAKTEALKSQKRGKTINIKLILCMLVLY